jgi:uncharacterized protein YndB with AHSA1/START domain
MLTGILAATGAIVAGLGIVVARRPSEFRVSRTIAITAPAPLVFAQVNDFRKWAVWSPYEKRDPAMRKTYEGPSAGGGAVYTWSGNKEVGEGRTTITESQPNDLIRIRLEFEKPFKATSTAEFAFEPDGSRTAVTWSLTGRHNFMMKVMCLFMNMDRMIGGDFEQGLAQMKAVAETAAARP